ncbi:MAG TPA: TlpA disulfide reductase family protein [Bacteroidota bacterium]|nr:TlpA disulfide reductase family protein [Bacteroidota bacterium]
MSSFQARAVVCALALLVSSCREGGGGGSAAGSAGRILPVTIAGIDSLRASSRSGVVLLNMWASWCAPCIDEMPALVRLRADYPDTDLDIIMVSTDYTEDLDSLVAPALAKAGVKFQTYIYAGGDDDALIRSLHPDWSGALPATFITGRGRPPMRWFVGGKSYEQLRAEVSGFLRP